MRLNSCAWKLSRAERHDWLKAVWKWLLPLLCHYLPRAVPKSREGRLRRDRVVVVVGDVLTADHDRRESTCGVAGAAEDAGVVIAGGVLNPAADAGVVVTGGV